MRLQSIRVGSASLWTCPFKDRRMTAAINHINKCITVSDTTTPTRP